MPDSRPDPDELGGVPSTSGPRRSGLDRLRAARGGGQTQGTSVDRPATDRSAENDRVPDSDEGTGRRSGSTALLDSDPAGTDRTGTERTGTDWTGTEADAEPADGGSATDVGTRSRGRGRGRASGAAVGTAAGTTKRGVTRPTAAAARPAARLQIVAVVVLALLVIGLAIPVVAMRHRIFGQSADAKRVSNLVETRAEASGAARRFTATFFTTDYKTIDAYSNQVAALSTGAFLADFNSKRADLKSLTTQAQSEATVQMLASGVSKVSGNTVEVLVVADQTINSVATKGKQPTVQRYRVRITVQKTPKGWLVSGLEPVV